MNKQKTSTGRGIEWTDYTWNPVAGCFHGCQWKMPDGAIANCYAEDVAERVAGSAYPEGFEHHYYYPDRLAEPEKVKQGSRIFVGSMADVFGHWVSDEQIKAIFETTQRAPQHAYQFLTKNPRRYLTLDDKFDNCWYGASTPPDFIWNKPLSRAQQEKMLHVTLDTFGQMPLHSTTWLSAEPLSWDITPILSQYGRLIDWIVIGAASNGRSYYPPSETHVRSLIEYCDDKGIQVFFKGNLHSLKWAADHWREDFPQNIYSHSGAHRAAPSQKGTL